MTDFMMTGNRIQYSVQVCVSLTRLIYGCGYNISGPMYRTYFSTPSAPYQLIETRKGF